MKKTERIGQKHGSDCAVCALAMFLGYDYDEFIQALPFLVEKVREDGLDKATIKTICLVLRRDLPICTIDNRYDPDRVKTKQIFKLLKGVPAIMSARSLNVTHAAHAVYWDGTKIIDPSPKKKYTKGTINPFEVIF